MKAKQTKLYDWGPSPFCLKVRAVLDYKRIPYERVNPIGPALLTVRRRGRIGKVPALEIGGDFLVDSTDIAYELDKRFPEPKIVPQHARDRSFCHVLEDWADESLYFIGLYYQWYEPEGRLMVPRAFGRSIAGRIAYRFYLRKILGQLEGQGTLRKPPDHVRSDLERHLDAIESLLVSGPYLLGSQPYLCDFAVFAQLVYLSRTPVGGLALRSRAPIQRFVEDMRGLRGPAAGAGS